MAASAKSHRACGPSFVFLARPRSCDALKSPRNATGIVMTNLHRSPPLNQSKIDLGIVNESQLLRFGIRPRRTNHEGARPAGRDRAAATNAHRTAMRFRAAAIFESLGMRSRYVMPRSISQPRFGHPVRDDC